MEQEKIGGREHVRRVLGEQLENLLRYSNFDDLSPEGLEILTAAMCKAARTLKELDERGWFTPLTPDEMNRATVQIPDSAVGWAELLKPTDRPEGTK